MPDMDHNGPLTEKQNDGNFTLISMWCCSQ